MRILFTLYLLLFTCYFSSGQNSFITGAKIGYGTSAFHMNAVLYIDGSAESAKSGSVLSTGVIERYMIGDLIGIESGALINHYSFYLEKNFDFQDVYWKTAADLELLNYQMPVIVNYKLKLRHLPFTYFLFSGGTTIDWFFPDLYTGRSSSFRPQTFQNHFASVKRGREKLQGKIEVGLELQYSRKHFEFGDRGYNRIEKIVQSKLNIIALNISYFFFTKELRKTVI